VTGPISRWEGDQDGNNRLGEMSLRQQEEPGKNMRRNNCRKTNTDGEA
jgi:hypothetical protein